jgi:hypothetical protein
MALQHYQGQYEKFPQAIAQAAKDTLVNFKITADATVKASAEAAKADLAQAVAASAKEVAHHVAGKEKLQWLVGSIAAAFITFGVFGWYMHSSGEKAGYNSGYGVGYTEAKDEKAAAAWANTPEGRTAYRFARSGELQRLARCSGKGWKVEKGNLCYPYAVSPTEGTYGWAMP